MLAMNFSFTSFAPLRLKMGLSLQSGKWIPSYFPGTLGTSFSRVSLISPVTHMPESSFLSIKPQSLSFSVSCDWWKVIFLVLDTISLGCWVFFSFFLSLSLSVFLVEFDCANLFVGIWIRISRAGREVVYKLLQILCVSVHSMAEIAEERQEGKKKNAITCKERKTSQYLFI